VEFDCRRNLITIPVVVVLIFLLLMVTETMTTLTCLLLTICMLFVDGTNHNLIIATHMSSMLVYKDMQLLWASKMNTFPVAVRVARFGGLAGKYLF
jgi:cell division protein FtsW (lipid II flippase)